MRKLFEDFKKIINFRQICRDIRHFHRKINRKCVKYGISLSIMLNLRFYTKTLIFLIVRGIDMGKVSYFFLFCSSETCCSSNYSFIQIIYDHIFTYSIKKFGLYVSFFIQKCDLFLLSIRKKCSRIIVNSNKLLSLSILLLINFI